MLGTRTLLVNPPLIGGIAFTRQGRCQEREEVLGTTKPPYTLALVAAMLRDRGCDIRLADLTATGQSVEDLIARLDREGFQPTLVMFPSTTPTLDADVARDGQAQGSVRRAAVFVRPARVLHAWRVDGSGRRAWTACSSASRRTDCSHWRRCRQWTTLDTIPSLTFRRAGRNRRRTGRRARSPGFSPRRTPRGICSTSRSTGCRSSTRPTSSSRPPAGARIRAISASRRFTRATSSARRARRNWSTRWSAATATSA